MPKHNQSEIKKTKRTMRPALTPDADENQLVSLAMDLVRERLINGTASSQETTHFLRIGSSKERLEKEVLKKQMELTDAKVKSLKSAEQIEELYSNALKAMRDYSASTDDEVE